MTIFLFVWLFLFFLRELFIVQNLLLSLLSTPDMSCFQGFDFILLWLPPNSKNFHHKKGENRKFSRMTPSQMTLASNTGKSILNPWHIHSTWQTWFKHNKWLRKLTFVGSWVPVLTHKTLIPILRKSNTRGTYLVIYPKMLFCYQHNVLHFACMSMDIQN